MHIGISALTHAGQSIWENGLGQNVIFLAELFAQLPFVQMVSLLDTGEEGKLPQQVDFSHSKVRLVKPQAAGDELDVIIEMAGLLETPWLNLMRARCKHIVYFCYGQPYVCLAEPAVFARPMHAPEPGRYDEVWYLPKDAMHAPMLQLLYRCETHEMPYIWAPHFVEQRMREAHASGLHYGFMPCSGQQPTQSAGMRVAVFEPNVSVIKTSTIPMLIADVAYRTAPHSVAHLHVLNTLHMKEHPTMLFFANSLDLVKQHKATFHGRYDVVGFLTQYANAVVAHQWCNDQNYNYLDVLYGDYPLIHNSPWLKEAGYYYPDFEIEAGAAQLCLAGIAHTSGIDLYRARSASVFRAVSPFAVPNLERYGNRLRCIEKRRVNTSRKSL